MNISEHFNSLLDAIPETIVVVSESGVILWVNQSWRDFAIGNGAARSTVTGVGLDYFGVCRAAGLETLCEGIRSVALGVRKELEFEYACHPPSGQRWFTLKVRQLGSLAGVAVLTHSNCTDRKLAEGEQAARCEEMKRVLDTVEAIIVSLDRDAVVTSINAYGERLLGRPAAEIVGSNWFERCIPPLSQRERVRSVFQTLIDDQWSRQEPFVNDVLTAAGERRTISWRNAVLKDAEGLVVGILSAGLDLTEEVQLSRQLALSHDAMMRAEAIGHFGSWWWDREEGAWRASEQARCLFGLDAAVCFNPASILRRIHRDDRRMVLGNWRAMLSGGAREYEYRLVAADGGVWLRDRVWIRAEADTGVTHCYGTSQDITSSKLTALALGESERLLVEAQETARIGTYVYDMVLDRWTSSRVLDQIMGIGAGYSRTLSGWLALIHEDDRAAMQAYFEAIVVAQEPGFDREYRIVRVEDGCMRWVHGHGKLERDAAGLPVRMLGTIADVTDRKLAEIALHEAREGYMRLFMLNPLPMWVCCRDALSILEVNNAAVGIYGYSREAFLGMKVTDLDPGTDGSGMVDGGMDLFLCGGHRHRRANGDWFDVELWSESVDYQGHTAILVIGEDITPKKRLEAVLARKLELAEQLKHIAATVPGAIYAFRLHPDGSYSLPFIDGKELEILAVATDQFSEDGAALMRYVDDSDVEVLMQSIHSSARTMSLWHEQFRIRHPVHGIRWLEGNAIPQAQDDGSVLWHGYLSDVTRRVEDTQRLEQSHEEIRTLAAHMEVIREEERSRIARELHDELGQTLTAVRMNLAQIAYLVAGQDGVLRGRLDELEQIVAEAMVSVRRISQELHPRVLDSLGLDGAIQWECNEFQKRMGIRCECLVDAGERTFHDRVKIHLFRACQEALTNVARHAAATSVQVSLSVIEKEVVLVVRDNGIGIQSGNAPVNSLGLTGMKERAAHIGGTLSIKSVPTIRGTQVELRAPLEQVLRYTS